MPPENEPSINVNEPSINAERFFSDTGADALALIPLDAVESELTSVAKAWGVNKHLAAHEDISDMEDDEWREIITDLLSRLGPLAENGTAAAWISTSSLRTKMAIGAQIGRALRAARYAKKSRTENGQATGALLPISFARRISAILGLASLPIAWVHVIDVLDASRRRSK